MGSFAAYDPLQKRRGDVSIQNVGSSARADVVVINGEYIHGVKGSCSLDPVTLLSQYVHGVSSATIKGKFEQMNKYRCFEK